MLRFVTRRLWEGGLTLAALVTLTFFVMRLAPGGPFSKTRKLSAEVLANIQRAYHLDEPVYLQFARYFWGLLHFDFGPSTRFRDYSVGDIIASGLPYSLTIGFWAVVVATHSREWAVGQVVDGTLEQPGMAGSSKDQKG